MQAVLRGEDGGTVDPARPYFRMHMVGYLEGIDSERGIEWRCADSLSLREFLDQAGVGILVVTVNAAPKS